MVVGLHGVSGQSAPPSAARASSAGRDTVTTPPLSTVAASVMGKTTRGCPVLLFAHVGSVDIII